MASLAVNAVRDLGLPHAFSEKGIVTVSIGVAGVRGTTIASATLVHEADTALYRAKADGRDCARIHGRMLEISKISRTTP